MDILDTAVYHALALVSGVAPLGALARSEPVNALLGWFFTGVLALAVIESFRMNALLWGAFLCVSIGITVLPPWVSGDWTVMVPWPLLFILTAVVLVRAVGLYPETAGYFVIAALALIVVVELDAFTPVEMSRRFAIGFAVLTTLAIQGLWIIAQYYSDFWLRTDFLHSQRELQVDIVIVTVIGLVMGLVFEWYVTRVEHVGSHRRPINSP